MYPRSLIRHLFVFSRAIVFIVILLALVGMTTSVAFASDTGFSSPGVVSTPGKSWTNVSYSMASDNLYATSKKTNKQLKLSNFTIPGIPGGATIDGIEVRVEGFTGGLQANVALSYNGGTNYTTAFSTALTGTESINSLGGPTNTWGRSWGPSDFTNANFIVRLTTTGTGDPIYVDQIQVRVYYSPPPTTLTLSPVTGPYGGTASMSATLTLTAAGTPISLKNIDFYLGGNGLDVSGNCTGTYAGSAATNGSGVATLASADLSGINAGSYPYGACARYAGDLSYQGTSISGNLIVVGTSTELVAAPTAGTYGGTVTLSATLTSEGSPVNGEWITFYLFGNPVGNSKTNNSGVASLPNVSLVGYNAETSNDIGASFEGNSNLDPANANALLTIDPRPITVTALKDTKVYDGTTSSSGVPKITSGSLVTGDTASFTQAFASKDVGTGKIITPVGVVADDNSGLNYIVSFAPVTNGAINKAPLTVTADNKLKFVGQPDPAFTYRYTGLVGSDTGADIDTKPVCTVSVAHNTVGTYPIVCSGGADNNYNLSYINGTLTVSNPTFSDVPTAYWAWNFIERLYAAGITGGCSTTPLNYCPDSTVTRAQMAVFLLKGVHGSNYTPPAVGGSTGFADVPTTYWAAPWIKQLAAEGITGGCGGGNFCPDTPVTRAQMAVFLLKSKHGVSYTPPAAVGVFNDVPVGYWADKWIEQLAAEGITGGCGGGNYCPDTPVTRAQMAVFLVKTFNLP
ncbi:MAG: hypothetical protein C3F07_09930 [Anaerolineales bacterium]|nr:MAG: hypothetical protein C3F07_09930 [Anaerolineales bacterium]